MVAKTDDSIPLNRMSKIFAREGSPIARSTLCALFHRAAELLEPLYARLVSIARGDPYMNADETRLPVQAKNKCRKAWIWTFTTPTIIIYKFSPTREAKVAESILAGSTGTLQVDGYSGYTKSCDGDGRRRVGCWGHTRRAFFKCHKECDEHQDQYAPEGPMSKAIGYAIKQWETLLAFLDDPRLRLDNNVSERALRIIALGRLILQSLIATCKLNAVNPYDYFTDVPRRVIPRV